MTSAIKVTKRVFIGCAVLLAAVYLLTLYLRHAAVFFPAVFPAGNWDRQRFARPPAELTFPSGDGERLNAWLFRAANPGAPLAIWCHGNAGNLTNRAVVASELSRRGVSVLVFDWRGYGKSTGTPSEKGLQLDALAAYDFAVNRLGVKPASILIYGESLGGPYAAYLAKERRARAVVIENSFPSLMLMGNHLYPLPLGYFAPFALTTTKWLNEAGAPVLVLHSRRDQVIPFELGLRLYTDLDVSKELFVSDRALHGDIPAVEGNRYYDAVTRFTFHSLQAAPGVTD